MKDGKAYRANLRSMLAQMAPADIQQMLMEERQAQLHEAELAKGHPLVQFRLSPEDWEALCVYLSDGGGVTADLCPSLNGKCLTQVLWQAIYGRDQATFMREMPHLLKSWVAARGLISQVPGSPGATITSGLLAPEAPAMGGGKPSVGV